MILVVSLDNFFPIALRYFHAKGKSKLRFYGGGGGGFCPVKTAFYNKICIFLPCCHGNEKMVVFFCVETYFIEFSNPKNVHFDTNIIIIARTGAKI